MAAPGRRNLPCGLTRLRPRRDRPPEWPAWRVRARLQRGSWRRESDCRKLPRAIWCSWRALQRPLLARAIPLGLDARKSLATLQVRSMCNLYSITTNQAAIAALFRVMNRYVGNLPPMPGVFPDSPAPVVRNAGDEREMVLMRWGMPCPHAQVVHPSPTSATPRRRTGAAG